MTQMLQNSRWKLIVPVVLVFFSTLWVFSFPSTSAFLPRLGVATLDKDTDDNETDNDKWDDRNKSVMNGFAVDRRKVVARFDRPAFCKQRQLGVDECVIVSKPPRQPQAAATHLNQTVLGTASLIEVNEQLQSSSRGKDCLLKFWRSTDVGCSKRVPQIFKKNPAAVPSPLCPCIDKRIVVVHMVTVLATLRPGCQRCVDIHTIIAVTKTLPSVALNSTSQMSVGEHNNSHISSSDTGMRSVYYLIDASSSQFVFLTCLRGEKKMIFYSPEVNLAHLMSRFALRNSQQSSNDRQPQKKKSASRQQWSCSALRAHRLARGGNESGNATTPPVYYALDLHAGIAGHALEELLSGIGQYVQEGLRELQIPWLVPCSDEWQNNRSPGSRAPLIWTQFFLELNDALQFPFYPVDFYKHFDVDSPGFSPLVFSAVHFASAHFGMNALCFKKLLESLLWPHAARLGGERNWTDVSEKRFESLYDKFPLPMPARLFRNSLHAETSSFVGAGQNNTRSVAANIALSSATKWGHHHEGSRNPLRNASNGSVLQPTNRWQSNKRIAILKVHKKTSTTGSLAPVVNSLERSYLYSLRFDRLLLLQRILPLSPTLSLFERMWHVNNADLIVTTWGSTSTTVMNLLFEGHRQHNHSGGVNDDDHGGSRRILTKRILVLVHSSYCHEAFHVFRTSKKFLCDPQRFSQTLPSTRLLSTIVRQKVSRNTGDLADHYGGKHFCVMYVLTQSLRLVGRRELDFRC